MLKNRTGFTMIELISVMLIIGIAAAVLAERMLHNSYDDATAKPVIMSHIRYAQLMAIKSGKVCGIAFDENIYYLFCNSSTLDKISLPGHDGTDFFIPSSFGTVVETIYFDMWGIPYTDSHLKGKRSTGPVGSLGITVVADTGYVQ